MLTDELSRSVIVISRAKSNSLKLLIHKVLIHLIGKIGVVVIIVLTKVTAAEHENRESKNPKEAVVTKAVIVPHESEIARG